jgi:hypothetical protein
MLLKKHNKNLAFTKPDWYGNPLTKKGFIYQLIW